jgi:membrane-associated phospholipid phosphatase
VVAAATGAARVLLNAHWLSDVAGGLAVGVLWLGVVMLAVSGREP